MSRAFFNWSSGKDSALALHAARRRGGLEVASLLTTVSAAHRRVSQHGVRVELLERQAAALGLPLDLVWRPKFPGMVEYTPRPQDDNLCPGPARPRVEETHFWFCDLIPEEQP